MEQALADWGLPALFALSLLEGDAVAFLGGALAHRGVFPFLAVSSIVALAAFLADEALYFAGRGLGRSGPVRRLREGPSGAAVAARVASNPVAYVFGFRFLYGMRMVSAASLGASGVPARIFVPVNLAACLVWAHLATALGWLLGAGIERLLGELPLGHHLGAVAFGFAAVVLGVVGWRLRRA